MIPGLGRYPGEGKGCPLQYSGLYGLWGCKESNLTEWLSLSFHLQKLSSLQSTDKIINCYYYYWTLLTFSSTLLNFFRISLQYKNPNHTSSSFGFIPYPYVQIYQQIQLFFPSAEGDCGRQYLSEWPFNHGSWIVFTWTITITIFHYLQLSRRQLILHSKTHSFSVLLPTWKLRKNKFINHEKHFSPVLTQHAGSTLIIATIVTLNHSESKRKFLLIWLKSFHKLDPFFQSDNSYFYSR